VKYGKPKFVGPKPVQPGAPGNTVKPTGKPGESGKTKP
jgi:hypothetical protein